MCFFIYFLSVPALAVLLGLYIPSTVVVSSVIEFMNTADGSLNSALLTYPASIYAGLLVIWLTGFYFSSGDAGRRKFAMVLSAVLLFALLNQFVFSKSFGTLYTSLKFDGAVYFPVLTAILNIAVELLALGGCALLLNRKPLLLRNVAAILAITLLRPLEEKRGSPHKDVVTVGQTYMDYLLKRKENVRPQTHDRPTVLVAPSWGATSLLNRFGPKLLDALIAAELDVTLRPHPQSFTAEPELIRSLQSKYPESDRFHWNTDSDNFNVLSNSDILISDFSGVICDYAFIFERPVLYSGDMPDRAKQDEAWLDEPYWGTKMLPQIGMELKDDDLPSVGEIVRKLINSDDYRASIRAVRDVYWQNRGKSSEKVVDYILNKVKELTPDKAATR